MLLLLHLRKSTVRLFACQLHRLSEHFSARLTHSNLPRYKSKDGARKETVCSKKSIVQQQQNTCSRGKGTAETTKSYTACHCLMRQMFKILTQNFVSWGEQKKNSRTENSLCCCCCKDKLCRDTKNERKNSASQSISSSSTSKN